ncbi:uncharacterized protein C8Q71DRAFT_186803 [Rhodofomes roseus]|uniref:BTB domain-containing protein n=1 Tax=Rhodofomes roseus TaxID=34475 RepID=A0ABQ8K9H2_9APHY|nr:uncharacterized protein C8Q71DRAFT_186803 [Rhodofomes roseus]KAH9833501.1 hypothetical protein C8Q71DRAFT_186803 [Rhodofomes roseus]
MLQSDARSPDAQAAAASPRRHESLYLEDGNVIFQVEDVLFNVHRYFFQRYSQSFYGMFLCKPTEGVPQEGSSDDAPIVLEQTSAVDFARLLRVFYPDSFVKWQLGTTEEWTSVLRLAHRWQFDNIVALVGDWLPTTATPVEQIALAREFHLPNIVGPAGVQLCARAEPLSLDETRQLGVDAAHVIWLLRENYRMNWRNMEVRMQDAAKVEEAFESLDRPDV